MKSIVISIITGCLVFTGLAHADEASEKAMQAATAMTKARQGYMRLQVQQFGRIGKAGQGKGPIDDATVKGAQNLYNLTLMLPDVFGEGSGMDDLDISFAKMDIWTNQEELDSLINRLQKQSERLLALANAGDEMGFKDGFKQIRGTCKKCHETFRFVPEKK